MLNYHYDLQCMKLNAIFNNVSIILCDEATSLNNCRFENRWS